MAKSRQQLAEDKAAGRATVGFRISITFPGYLSAYCRAPRAVLNEAEAEGGTRLRELALRARDCSDMRSNCF